MQRKFFSFLMVFAAVVLLNGAASAQQRFTAALNTIQEVPPSSGNGRGSCQIALSIAQTQITVACEFSNLSSGVTMGHIHGNASPGANAGVLFDLTPPTGVTSGNFTRTITVTTAQAADMRAKRWYVNIHTTNFPGGEIRGQIKMQTTPFDYDGDGQTNIRVYRPTALTTYILSSIPAFSNTIFGNVFGFANESNELTASASDDYDGDGRGDIVLLRTISGANFWRILQTGTNTIREQQWGSSASDDIVPADYDGDGRTDIAVYRFSTGAWYIIQSSTNQPRYEFWGQAGNTGEYGMVGDFDGDGKNDLTTIRGTANGVGWFTRRSSDNTTQVNFWGGATAPASDFIFPSAQVDVDNDGIQDRMVVRDADRNVDGSQVTVFVERSTNRTQLAVPFGRDTDDPFFGDYDGDGRTDFAARRAEGGIYTWYIALSSNNYNTANPRVVRFGQTGDLLAPELEAERPLTRREVMFDKKQEF